MLGRSIPGLDLGTWSVKACELRQELRESTLIRFEAQRFPNSASEEERARIVEDFLIESRLPTDFVISALACSHATTQPKSIMQLCDWGTVL